MSSHDAILAENLGIAEQFSKNLCVILLQVANMDVDDDPKVNHEKGPCISCGQGNARESK